MGYSILTQGVKICIYSNDHVPPHVHAKHAEYEVVIDIRTLEIINGKMKSKAKERLALDYVRDNQEDLLDVFYQSNPQIKRI